ncbi:AI-2E family transporter [Bacteriovorax sp. PP10]|uniref:AI-2E family transporter n=1 Tax=Bacteriovorax antarcticus TaxID=3088717 RepID=A0ABU5VPG0_9BACT|nr:AI-2E family transporter [Bacteriovorax sp. PP10]MEA9354886.1 AI-2E family transporter [Bacteriovorax sp. PP10]
MILSNRKNIVKIQLAFFAVVIVLFCALVLTLPRISIPLSLAYILSLALNPIVNWLMKFKLNKTQATIVVFIALVVFVGIPLVKVIPVLSMQTQDIQYTIPKVEEYVIHQYAVVTNFIKAKTGHEVADGYIFQTLAQLESWASEFVVKLPNYLATLLEWIFLVPFFTFFMIRDGDTFKKTFLSFTPNTIFERFYYVMHVFNRQLGDYFFAKFVEAIIVGGIITIGLLIMGVNNAAILGFLAGLTNIVPYVGPILGLIPAIFSMMLDPTMASSTMGAVLILYAVANAVDAFFVFPFLVSKIVNLHPVIVAISVIVGSHYAGITGMVVSIPVVAAIKLIITEIYNEIYTERSR